MRPIPGRAVVVFGARDRCIAPAAFAHVSRHFRRPPAVHTLDAGHFLPTEAPDAVLAIIVQASHADPRLRGGAHDETVTDP